MPRRGCHGRRAACRGPQCPMCVSLSASCATRRSTARAHVRGRACSWHSHLHLAEPAVSFPAASPSLPSRIPQPQSTSASPRHAAFVVHYHAELLQGLPPGACCQPSKSTQKISFYPAFIPTPSLKLQACTILPASLFISGSVQNCRRQTEQHPVATTASLSNSSCPRRPFNPTSILPSSISKENGRICDSVKLYRRRRGSVDPERPTTTFTCSRCQGGYESVLVTSCLPSNRSVVELRQAPGSPRLAPRSFGATYAATSLLTVGPTSQDCCQNVINRPSVRFALLCPRAGTDL